MMKDDKIKIAIISREETLQKCIAKGCFRAFNNYEDSFARYAGRDIELAGFCHEGGSSETLRENLDSRIESFKAQGVTAVHVSSCLRSRSPHYDEIMSILGEEFDVVGYTHGSENTEK